MDLPGDNTPGHTISANGLRRRSQGVDGLENATSTSVNQTKAAGSASPFVRVYVEESRKTKGKHHFKTDGDSGVIEGVDSSNSASSRAPMSCSLPRFLLHPCWWLLHHALLNGWLVNAVLGRLWR
ncbi:hypothetical protein FRC15_005502 [Serendipita sp. 397]|nr:hypothetical protein FRC15_005502 [Serendipita sp. 397]